MVTLSATLHSNSKRALARGPALAGLVVLAGCSTLPTIVPDMARSPRTPVQLERTQGPSLLRAARRSSTD